MSSAAARDPISAYRALLQSGELVHDDMQELAVEMLQTLHVRLKHYQKEREKGVLQRLIGRGRHEDAPLGLYLFGDVGRGKSMLMDLFFESAPVPKKRRVHFHEFMQEVHEGVHAWRGMDEAARQEAGLEGDDPMVPLARKIAEGATLLCFDEFQVNDVADAMILGRLFEGLFAQGVVMVITSNTPPDHLYEDGLNRSLFLPFIALIKERLDLLHLASPTDYRLERMRGVPVYHTPLGAESEAKLDAAFRRLTDRDEGDAEKLEVKGRKLAVLEAAKGVARFTFDGLCREALGAADYLAIAKRYPTVILSGIPRMNAEERNEARRFVTLIDVLYEARTRLICSAAAAPDQLYKKGDSKFEFARTASRLMEMQSADYLGG